MKTKNNSPDKKQFSLVQLFKDELAQKEEQSKHLSRSCNSRKNT